MTRALTLDGTPVNAESLLTDTVRSYMEAAEIRFIERPGVVENADGSIIAGPSIGVSFVPGCALISTGEAHFAAFFEADLTQQFADWTRHQVARYACGIYDDDVQDIMLSTAPEIDFSTRHQV